LKMVKIKLNDLLFAEQNVESLLCIKLWLLQCLCDLTLTILILHSHVSKNWLELIYFLFNCL
jgi:hypothetical protein